MKKIIRTAIVIALAGAALLSTGCTKDVSSDINALQNQVTELQTTVAALNAFKAEAQTQIEEHENNLAALAISVSLLAAEIDAYETATDAQLAALNEKVEKHVTEIYEAITAVTGRVAALEAAYEAVQDAIEALAAQIDAVAARITSIVAVPSTSAEILAIKAAGVSAAADTTIKTFVAEFEVSPAKAADRLTDADLQISFKEGASKAPINAKADVKIVKNEKGVITIKAFAPKADAGEGNALYYSLVYAGKDEVDSTYYVQSAYTKAAAKDVEASYAMVKSGKVMSAYYDGFTKKNFYKDTTTTPFDVLAPLPLYSEDIALNACIDGKYYTIKEYAELLGIAEPKVTTKDTACRTTTIHDLYFPFKKNAECEAAAAVLFDTTNVQTFRAEGTIVNVIGADICNKSIGCTYLINGNEVLYLDRFAAISKRTKADADVTAAQKTTWNYTEGADVFDKKFDIAVPEYYNKKALTDVKSFKITPATGNAGKETYDFYADNKKAEIQISDFPYETKTVDYTVAFGFDCDTMNFALNVPWTVTKKAEDVILDLGDSTVAFAASGNVVETVKGVFARTIVDTALWAGETKASKAAIYSYFVPCMMPIADSVYCDGKNVGKIANLVWANDKVDITLTGVKPGKTYKVYMTNKVAGVKISYTQNITVKELTYKLATDPLFVKDDLVTAKGTITGGKYALDAIDLANYFKVDGTIPSGDELKVKFSTYTEYERKTDTLGTGAAPAAPADAAVTNATGRIDASKVDWTLTARRLAVVGTLINSEGVALGDSILVGIEAPQTVKDFKAGEIAKDRINGQDLVINLWTDLFASSCLADTNIFAPKAATFAAAVASDINYGQAVEFNWSKAKAELNGAAYTMDSKYFVFDDVKGTLTVSKECGLFTAPLKITIPAAAGYYLDYAGKQALKSDLVITITQK